tara:strand:- start:1320 stop:1601 length:282 start_codon:yes stop_codon:yes gene_type:complete
MFNSIIFESEEEQKKYDTARDAAYAEMFSTQGWKYLMEYLTQQATRADSIENIDSMEELHLNRGKLKIIALLLNLEATTEHNRENEGSKLEWS